MIAKLDREDNAVVGEQKNNKSECVYILKGDTHK